MTALRRAGRPITPGMTLSELELRLGGARGSDSYLAALRAARYGGAGAPTRDQRNAFRRELAAGLGWRGRLRAWWALPPQLLRVAPRPGFEPGAYSLGGSRSIQLSYRGPGRHRSSDVETNPSVRLSGVVLDRTVYLLWPLKEGQLRQFIQAPEARV